MGNPLPSGKALELLTLDLFCSGACYKEWREPIHLQRKRERILHVVTQQPRWLKHALKDDTWHPRTAAPAPMMIHNQPHHEVECILDSKLKWGVLYYLIKWRHFPISHNEWVR